jgi:small subunit ribosomal protein S17
MAETLTTSETLVRKIRKSRKGVVISRSGNKSIVVQAERRRVHPKYGKVIREFKKFHAHDERNEAQVGDHVEISECRPISRLKHWRLVAVTQATKGAQQA